jgi:hypothetical protein
MNNIDIDDDHIILICATGRSGSTTTQRILNTIPNSNFCGENFGAINHLLMFYKNIKKTYWDYIPKNKFNKPASKEELEINLYKPCWYNSFDFKEIKLQIKTMIKKMFKIEDKTKYWGFKEIRYDDNKIQLIKEFKELFPQTKVIIQIRENLVAQSKSSWYAENIKQSMKYLSYYNNQLIQFQKENNSYCYMFTFNQMCNLFHIKKLFTNLNILPFYNEIKINYILNNNLKD